MRPSIEGGDTPEQKTAKAALRARFIAYELPEDFVENLHFDREAIRTTNQQNDGKTQGGVENTEAIGQILGLAALDMQELDTIMRNKYSRNGAKLAAWESASRVERAAHREKKPAAPADGTPTAPKPNS